MTTVWVNRFMSRIGIRSSNKPTQLTPEVEMLNVINLILGGALLVAGRKLFWLFVGAAGFVAGMQLATRFWQGSDILAIIIGLVIGVIFALLAIFLQAIVIGIAGFLSGGYVLTVLVTMLGIGAFHRSRHGSFTLSGCSSV